MTEQPRAPTHRETVQAYNEAMRRFEATLQAFGSAIETLWLALRQGGPSDTQLALGTEVLVSVTQHLRTLINMMARQHEARSSHGPGGGPAST
jgi:hypothetical protein